ncbi:hypothetical protein [Nonomuraea endophytica]|uniref:hypothetical protein n=1 Tax=Nonomuraea endophytica TaxID=714136 RepID=UPI0037C8260C
MAELKMIAIRHPDVDDGKRVIEVPKMALPVHLAAGWELAEPDPSAPDTPEGGDPPTGTPEKPDQAPETPGLSHDQQLPRRKRVTTKEGE